MEARKVKKQVKSSGTQGTCTPLRVLIVDLHLEGVATQLHDLDVDGISQVKAVVMA